MTAALASDPTDGRYEVVAGRWAYIAAVLAYVTITLLTKRLLTWNLGIVYFVVTLDLLPRGWHRIRGWSRGR